MKTLDEILDQYKPSKEWKDRPILSSYDPFRGMAAADFDGIGVEDTYIPLTDADGMAGA